MAIPVSKSDEKMTQISSAKDLQVGDLAVVIEGKGGANHVRRRPKIGAHINGKIPEHAVLAILPSPDDWTGQYPHRDGEHVWWYVRGRTDARRADGRFKIVEGWTAASKHGTAFLLRMETSRACLDTMGTALDTHLEQGQEAYVLPADGLNVREEADPNAVQVGGLRTGTVVTVTDSPACDTKMVWWRVEPANSAGPKGWSSEGSFPERFLVPLTLM